MFNPDYDLGIDNDCAVFTIGSMEQLGKNYTPFLNFLTKKKVGLCINIETLYEIYNQELLFDYMAAKFLEKREYLQGYIKSLLEMQEKGEIEILDMRRTFGSLFYDGYSYVVWRPIK